MSRDSESGFYFDEMPNGWKVGRFAALDAIESVVHVITTRQGPQISADVEDADPAAQELLEQLNLKEMAYCSQVHGNVVLPAQKGGLVGLGDGIVTNQPRRGLMGRSADCALIIAADPISGAVGMAHASWRGIIGRIASQLVTSMVVHFEASLDTMIACISPAAGPCCYEVGKEIVKSACERIGPHADNFFKAREGKMYFDMWAANVDELTRAGLASENIHVAGICTICRNDLFPSYRMEGQAAGRFAAVIAQD